MSAFSPAFTVSQSAEAPANVTVTDTSTGDLGTITQRRLIVQDAYSNYLTGDGTVNYDEWALADDSITISTITNNVAANFLVQWLNSSNVIVSQTNNNYPLPQFGKQFFVYLIQSLGLTPATFQDSNYSGNLSLFWAYLNAGINQVEDGNDLAGAQNCFSLCNEMKINQNKYF